MLLSLSTQRPRDTVASEIGFRLEHSQNLKLSHVAKTLAN
jgi:hypothetical protein